MKTTINHQEIRQWIESHGGKPAIIDDPGAGANKLGLRVDFAGPKDEKLLSSSKKSLETDWERFFEIFEDMKLAFTYEDKNSVSDPTMAYEFVKRDRVKGIAD